MKTDSLLPMPVKDIIPHGPQICMIDRLLEFENGAGILESIILSESIFIDESGVLEPSAMVELVAQSYAAVKGYEDRLNGKPVKQGFLVGISEFDFLGRAFTGDKLQIFVKTAGIFENFAMVEGKISCGEKVIASGSIKFWIIE